MLLLGGILVASGLLVGIVDMLRPSSQQTHVGRFFDRVTRDGFSEFFLVIRRKAMENFGSLTSTRLVWLIPIGGGLLAFLWLTRAARSRCCPEHLCSCTRSCVRAHRLLGFALNDSGMRSRADGGRARVRPHSWLPPGSTLPEVAPAANRAARPSAFCGSTLIETRGKRAACELHEGVRFAVAFGARHVCGGVVGGLRAVQLGRRRSFPELGMAPGALEEADHWRNGSGGLALERWSDSRAQGGKGTS